MVSILKKPSSLIHEICIEKVDGWKLFKFSEALQQRMETLLEKKKADQLLTEEIEELDTIGELDRIFTHINAMMAVQDVDQSLPRDSQAILLARFLEHLGRSNEIDQEVASVWGEEAELHDQAMDSDRVTGIPAEQVFQLHQQAAIKGLKGKLPWDGNLDEN